MGQIIDKTKEHYKDLKGAKYLEFISNELPSELIVYYSNVSITGSGKLTISRFPAKWGWVYHNSFHKNFDTPEEAVEDFKKYFKRK